MSHADPAEITELLQALGAGEPDAESRLLGRVYDELRRLAHREVGRHQGALTLDPTGLVHEAFMKLVAGSPGDFRHRRHFFEVAAKAMRRLLVDRYRTMKRLKRGGDLERVPLAEVEGELPSGGEDLEALDGALSALAEEFPEAARIVELRFFGGLEVTQTAELLEVSESTVKRQWRFARAWLREAVKD